MAEKKTHKVCARCKQNLTVENFRITKSDTRTKASGEKVKYPKRRSICKKCQNKVVLEKNRRTPLHNLARLKVRYAVKKGLLVKLPCRVCGAEKVEGHHPDYDKPLEVIWLCPKHHTQVEYGFIKLD